MYYDTSLPSYAVLSDGKTHDATIAKQTKLPSESVLVVNRVYIDFKWLYYLDSSGVFFVTRLKSNADVKVVEAFLTDEKHDHIMSDQDIKITSIYFSKKYPDKLLIVKVYDEVYDQQLILVTNNLSWTADTISQLYKSRWDIEVFFKPLKQLFRVKTFVGTSANAERI